MFGPVCLTGGAGGIERMPADGGLFQKRHDQPCTNRKTPTSTHGGGGGGTAALDGAGLPGGGGGGGGAAEGGALVGGFGTLDADDLFVRPGIDGGFAIFGIVATRRYPTRKV